jgi:hypothetical protein
VINKLNGALLAAVATPDFQQRLKDLGARVGTGNELSPVGAAQFVRSEIDLWKAVAKGGSLPVAFALQQPPPRRDVAIEERPTQPVVQQAPAAQQVVVQQPPVNIAPSVLAPSGARVALVIGNSNYSAMPKLVNPRNDADDIGKVLKDSGFDVVLGTDLTRTGMEDALSGFSKKARLAETALVYFAGHGLQHNGINYLAPVDARLDDETDLRKLILLQNVIEDLQGASKVRLLFVDACRDNDVVQQLTSRLPRARAAAFTRGLAGATADGTLIAFATQPNRVAADGQGRNSPFAQALLKHLPTPGVELRTLLTRVRADVVQATGGAQRPEVSDSLVGEFAFR